MTKRERKYHKMKRIIREINSGKRPYPKIVSYCPKQSGIFSTLKFVEAKYVKGDKDFVDILNDIATSVPVLGESHLNN